MNKNEEFEKEEEELNKENKAVSAFHIQAEKAKQVLDEKEEQDKDPLNKKFLRYKTGKKGKGEGLSDKIKGAGVGDWREQKLTKLSFFENMRKIFLDKNQINKTFAGADIDTTIINDKLLDLEEGALPKNLTPYQIEYIYKLGNEMEKNYLENGLSKEEAELRLKTYGPNALPEPKKHQE